MLPYQNKDLTIRERVEDLLKRMTIKEKVGQINQHLYGWKTYSFDHQSKAIKIKKDFIDHIKWGGGIGALYGVFRADPWSQINYENGVLPQDAWKVANKIQKTVIENSRLHIPALLVEECPHGHQGLDSISYPTNIGKGNSFDTRLIRSSSHLIAEELACKGVNLALVSTLDLAKDPRWGRTEECFGEDPYLTSEMTAATIDGFQNGLINEMGDFTLKTVAQANPNHTRIGVVLKHCIAQGEAQGGHNSGTVVIGERDFKEIYYPLLKSCANAIGIMAAYNDINGVPCHINQRLLKNILREKYKFKGIIMADGLALDRLSDAISDPNYAASLALKAGVDLSLWDDTYTKVEEGIKKKVISEFDLDQAVRHVLQIKFLLGLFDHPYITDPKEKLHKIQEKSKKINKRLAEESITLVKNDSFLPLNDKVHQKIAVIGPNADHFYNMLGDYTSPQNKFFQKKTIYNSIKYQFKESQVRYCQGCEVRSINDISNFDQAIKLAKESDIIILVLGGSSTRNFGADFLDNGAVKSSDKNMDTGENLDLADLSLGGNQDKLLNALHEVNKNIVSILIQGRPYDVRNAAKKSKALLIGWYPGQEGGEIIANLLKGDVIPSGRLSISYPRNSQQLPVYYYQRKNSKQDNYVDEPGLPLYPFGFGLSYSTLKYKNLKISNIENLIKIKIEVENTGQYLIKTSILLFATLFGENVLPRYKLLKGFKRTSIPPRQSKVIVFKISKTSLSIYDYQMKKVRANQVKFQVGNIAKIINI